jgi:hypothetical protein
LARIILVKMLNDQGGSNVNLKEIFGMAKGKPRSRHDQLKKLLVDTLAFSRCFSDIRAEIPGYESPEVIICEQQGTIYIPDVTAQSDLLNIFEIETPYSLNSKKTEGKWCALANHIRKKKGKFWIVVPADLREETLEKIRMLDIIGGVLGL